MNSTDTDEKKPVIKTGTLSVGLECDATPLLLFIELFDGFLQRRNSQCLCFGDLPDELIRIERDDSAASAGEVLVKLYPSDAFLAFTGAIFAGNVNQLVVK